MDASDYWYQVTAYLRRHHLALVVVLTLLIALVFGQKGQSFNTPARDAVHEVALGSFPIIIPTVKYGLALDTFQVEEYTIPNGLLFSQLLEKCGLSGSAAFQLVQQCDGVFNVKSLRAGKQVTILSKDTNAGADYLIYQPSAFEYFRFQLGENPNVEKHEYEVQTAVKSAATHIESSLWDALVGHGLTYDLAAKMEKALRWSIDFHHVQQGDSIRLVYEEKSIEEKTVGVGEVLAAYYKTGGKPYLAFYFEGDDENKGYYDMQGRPMKKSFLSSPVEYSRISSQFSMSRFHPILKIRRPHLGTDYAAPYGTPILAIGDGVVTEAMRKGGNGNYVRIRHDGTYETQYLHMQKFAAGIRPGVHVSQGQVIGYVGSTGLATGPHVCFRFWMNGKQVNHLNLDFPQAKPLPENQMDAFNATRDRYLELLGLPPAQIQELIVKTSEKPAVAPAGNP